MILALRTDSPEAHMVLLDTKGALVAEQYWLAERQLAKGLLTHLESFIANENITFEALSRLMVFQGPGSFTGLRIGIATMNTMAYALSLPIVGATGDDWLEQGVGRLQSGDNDISVLPHYGEPARITQPKK